VGLIGNGGFFGEGNLKGVEGEFGEGGGGWKGKK